MSTMDALLRGCGVAALLFAMTGAAGCTNEVTVLDGDGDAGDGPDAPPDPPPSVGSGTGDPGLDAYGVPCAYLRGEATLPSWDGEESTYPASLYSFELASSDFAVVRNDGDVLYTDNMFDVNTVVDDASFIVDLGDLGLEDVPSVIDPDDFPTGEWGEHDAIGAVAHHTYAVRTVDGNTRQWAAFRVTALSPGALVGFAWIRSPDVDALTVPEACF